MAFKGLGKSRGVAAVADRESSSVALALTMVVLALNPVVVYSWDSDSMVADARASIIRGQAAPDTNGDYLNQQLFWAISNLDSTMFTRALEWGADVNARERSEAGFTPLMAAARLLRGAASSVAMSFIDRLLKNSQTNINAHSFETGDTALTIAAKLCHSEAIRLLVSEGADVWRSNNDGEDAIRILEKKCGDDRLIEFLSDAKNKEIARIRGSVETPSPLVSATPTPLPSVSLVSLPLPSVMPISSPVVPSTVVSVLPVKAPITSSSSLSATPFAKLSATSDSVPSYRGLGVAVHDKFNVNGMFAQLALILLLFLLNKVMRRFVVPHHHHRAEHGPARGR